MSLAEAALLGMIQGIAEWLPVSSEGVVAATHSLVFDSSLTEAVGFSLWLHLGTSISAIAAFRGQIASLIRNVFERPLNPSPLLRFLIVATASSAPLGFLLLIALGGFSARLGGYAMAVVGMLMILTATLISRQTGVGARTTADTTWLDSVLTGIAQGLAALPGLSRSGLTVSTLLARRVDRGDALSLSFLLSIPASIGAGIYGASQTGAHLSPAALVGVLVSAVVGFLSISLLLKIVQRVNFSRFVAVVGVCTIAGAVWQAL